MGRAMSSETSTGERHLSAIAGFRLVTADLPRLLAFYRDVLGFKADRPEQVIGEGEIRLLGLRGAGRRQILRLGCQSVAIDQFDNPGRPYSAEGDGFALVPAPRPPRSRKAAPRQLPASSGGAHAYKFFNTIPKYLLDQWVVICGRVTRTQGTKVGR